MERKFKFEAKLINIKDNIKIFYSRYNILNNKFTKIKIF